MDDIYRQINSTNQAHDQLRGEVRELLWTFRGKDGTGGIQALLQQMIINQNRIEAKQAAHETLLTWTVILVILGIGAAGGLTVLNFLFTLWDKIIL